MADGLPAALDGHWDAEPPDTPRTGYGIPDGKARLRALGNALVPQVAQWLGERILAAESRR